jgi:hypothetical protein
MKCDLLSNIPEWRKVILLPRQSNAKGLMISRKGTMPIHPGLRMVYNSGPDVKEGLEYFTGSLLVRTVIK